MCRLTVGSKSTGTILTAPNASTYPFGLVTSLTGNQTLELETRHTGSDKFGYTCQCLIIHVLNALRWTFTRKVMMRNRWETHRNEVKPWEIRGWNREKRGGTVRTALHVYQPHYFGYLSYLAVLFYAVHHQKESWSFCHGSYVRFLAKNCLVPKQSAGGAQLGDKSLGALGAPLESARCLVQGSRLKTHQESWSATCQLYITVPGWWFGTFFIFHYIWDNHPNWLIFFRGIETTNQVQLAQSRILNSKLSWHVPSNKKH